MGNLLTTGSLLAAFFAGGVALFAPCCIVFLLPSYMAAAVKNRRWRLLPLTVAFAAGLALVLVPITVGISLVAATISKYHIVFYWAGGLLMFALAAFSLSGRKLHPARRRSRLPERASGSRRRPGQLNLEGWGEVPLRPRGKEALRMHPDRLLG